MPWYYFENSQQIGPVEDTEFAGLVTSGQITVETLVWKDGMAEWLPYGQVAEIEATTLTQDISPVAEAETVICVVSGKAVPKLEAVQVSGQWVSKAHKNDLAKKLKTGEVSATGLVYSGFWIRVVAKIIDNVILMIVCGGLIALIIPLIDKDAVNQVIAAEKQQTPSTTTSLTGILPLPVLEIIGAIELIIPLIYYVLMVGQFGGTFGKLLLGMRVVRADGTPVSYLQATARFFAELLSVLIFYIGYIIVVFDPQKRSLHDRLCGTRVVKK